MSAWSGLRAFAGRAAIALGLVACKRTEPVLEPQHLALEWTGCSAITAGPICELSPGGSLHVWIALAPTDTIEVRASERVIPARDFATTGGRRLEIDASALPLPSRLVVSTRASDGRASRGEIALAASAPLSPMIEEAMRLRRQGETARARGLLEPALASLSVRERARAEGGLGRAALADGDTEAALDGLERARNLSREAGEHAGWATDSCTLARAFLFQARRPGQARAILESLTPDPSWSAEARIDVDYTFGLLAYETGDLRRALERFEAASARAERLGESALLAKVYRTSAHALRDVGFFERGAKQLEAAVTLSSTDPCERARVLTDVGWFALQGAGSAEAEAPLEEALTLYRQGCRRPVAEQNVLVNLALAALFAGRAGQAEARLGEATAIGALASHLAVWALEIRARIAAAQDPQAALAIWAHLEETARAGALPDALWRAKVGAGEALTKLKRHAAAIRMFREAEAILDEQTQRVPASSGRDGFLGGKDRAARALLELLLDRDRAGEALEVARRSRARALGSLVWYRRLSLLPAEARGQWDAALDAYWQERAALTRETEGDWELSAERLAAARVSRASREQALTRRLDEALALLGPVDMGAPRSLAPGELAILIHPGTRGWVILAATSERTAARRGRVIDPSAPEHLLAAELLEPFSDWIVSAKRLLVLSSGPFERVDVHALPFRGQPLIEHLPVVYGLDLPAGRAAPLGPPLIVADTLGDLPAARREAEFVAGVLAEFGPTLLVGTSLSHDRLRGALAGSSSLHYAGHGAFASEAFESALPLGDGTRFRVADVLALPSAPSRVVLTACESARSNDRAGVEALGLAQAFAIAGANQVVGETRPVADEAAEIFVRALYAAPELAADPAAAAREATRALRRQQPAADWASFRVIVR